MDADTGEVLHATNADLPSHPASLTKMMTLYLLFDALEQGKVHLGDRMPVSRHASVQIPSKLGLTPGQTLSVQDAILGLVTKSANDAAVVVAEYLGGSEPAFAAMMTKKAHDLGMRSTVFRNASGVPNPGQISTPRDMAILARALIRNHAKEYHYFSTREFDWGGQVIPTHNHILSMYDGADGIKTGFINTSGFNLVASAKRDGHRLIGVIFGGRTARARDLQMVALLDSGFAHVPAGPRLETAAAAAAAEENAGAAGRAAPASEDEAEDADVHAVMKAMSDGKPTPAAQTVAAPAATMRSADADEPEVAAAKPVHRRARVARAEAEESPWGIQLGAFRQRALAEETAQATAERLGNLAADAKVSIASLRHAHHMLYRARLVGLSEGAAERACHLLHHGHALCKVINAGTSVAAR